MSKRGTPDYERYLDTLKDWGADYDRTALLRVIAGAVEPDAGSVQRADGRTAYISQRLDLLDDACRWPRAWPDSPPR